MKKNIYIILFLITPVVFILAWSPWITKDYAEKAVLKTFEKMNEEIVDGCGFNCDGCGIKESNKMVFGYKAIAEYNCGLISANSKNLKASAFVSLFGNVYFSKIKEENGRDGNLQKITKIADIISNPKSFSGKTVIIDGKFGGWGTPTGCDLDKTGVKTKSDWVIYDDTGCLLVGGSGGEILYNEKPLDMTDQNSRDGKLKIKSIITLIDGKPHLGE